MKFFLNVTFSIVLLLFACERPSQRKGVKPNLLLSEKQMVEVLSDFQLAEAAVNQRAGLRQDIRAKQRQVYAEAILQKHSLQPQLFWDSYNYYITQPEILDTIYAQTLKILESKLPAAQEAMKKNPPPADVPKAPIILPQTELSGLKNEDTKKK